MSIIAIDFGTSTTGWAFFENSSKLCHEKLSAKESNPSIIMYENNLPIYWGKEAIERRTPEKEFDDKYQFFQEFKIHIAQILNNNDVIVQGSNGCKNLSVVLTDFFKAIKISIMSRLGCGIIKDENLKWTMTVPAIWDEKMKIFIKNAASNAGLFNNKYEHNFSFVYEPEAAAAYCCKEFKTAEKIKGNFLVVDCGGGTIDITALGQEGEDMYQLSRSSGGLAGGTFVDKEFLKFLNSKMANPIFTRDFTSLKTDEEKIQYYSNLVESFKEKFKEEMINFYKFMENWQTQKKNFISSEDMNTYIELNIPLIKLFNKQNLSDKIFNYDRGFIILTREDMLAIFNPSISQTITYIRDALAQVEAKIEAILMVGGYAECELLLSRVTNKFSNLIVKRPMQAVNAVVEGAVYFTLRPPITDRFTRYTYGIKTKIKYTDKYPLNLNESGYVNNVFSRLIEIGQKISTKHNVPQHYIVPAGSASIIVEMYQTMKKNGEFVHDSGMRKICNVSFGVIKKNNDADMHVSLKFGGTLLEVICDYNGKSYKGECNLD